MSIQIDPSTIQKITPISKAISSLSPFSAILKNIDELIRGQLEAAKHLYFWLLVIATIVVLLGVILEEAERWFAYLKRVVPIDSMTVYRWAKRLAHLGWVLIVIGVAGEGIFEVLVARADDKLQAFDNAVLVETRREAGDAAISAKNAQDSAEEAQRKLREVAKEADAAEAASARAKATSEAVSKQAKELQSDLTKLNKEFVDASQYIWQWMQATKRLANKVGKRSIDRDVVVAKLKDKPKGVVDILYEDMEGSEPKLFADEIKESLKAAGWDIAEFTKFTPQILSKSPWNTAKKDRGVVLVTRRFVFDPNDVSATRAIEDVLIFGPDFGGIANVEEIPALPENRFFVGVFEAPKPNE